MEERLATILSDKGQEHLLEHASRLSKEEQAEFEASLASIDWTFFDEVASVDDGQDASTGQLSESLVLDLADRFDELKEPGLEAYRLGEVAVVMVAGGQGSRLGYSGPKGCFSIGAVSGKSVYQYHAEKILALSRRFEKLVPFLIMTSAATHNETKEFFESHKLFGLDETQVHFFQQGMVPTLDDSGRALLSSKTTLMTNPDGHGGCFTALVRDGYLEKLKNEGYRHLVYLQVDNILGPVFDPELIGYAINESADVITKVVEKTKPEEKVGLLIRKDGKDQILEYIHLSESQNQQRSADGRLKYRWGNTAMHYWSVDYLWRSHSSGYQLPFHKSRKSVSSYTDSGMEVVEGIKHERFIFDLLPRASVSLGMEISRQHEFAPLKNADGADSVVTVHEITNSLYRSWLRAADLPIDELDQVEVSPLLAASESEFVDAWDGRKVDLKGDVYLE
jgi:UDP-N-acetylglucosamine/UDP-N-acetylgalactosamine diphosphorylase